MGSVLYVNKPKGISSFDVCFKLRRVLNTKKIGHTGTLDPNATGVMIVLFNAATKANQFLVSDSKEYIAKVKIGIETDTLDIDGEIIKQEKCIMPSKLEIEKVLNTFLGQSKQVVPLTSAIKINGKKLYQYQLEGKEVELPIRDINVFTMELLNIDEDTFTFKCKVSSGTYIRALARDILNKLNIIGTVLDLQRTKVDEVDIKECDNLEDILNGNYHTHELYDVLSLRYKTIEVDDETPIINGRRIKLDSNEEKMLIVKNKVALAIYQKDNNEYKCVRGLL